MGHIKQGMLLIYLSLVLNMIFQKIHFAHQPSQNGKNQISSFEIQLAVTQGLQGPNTPSEKLNLPNRKSSLIVTSSTPLEFHPLKLVEIPITTVFFLIKTWLTYSLTHSLTLSLTHSLSHSLTYLLTHLLTQKGWGKTIITVVCPKQKIVDKKLTYVFLTFSRGMKRDTSPNDERSIS